MAWPRKADTSAVEILGKHRYLTPALCSVSQRVAQQAPKSPETLSPCQACSQAFKTMVECSAPEAIPHRLQAYRSSDPHDQAAHMNSTTRVSADDAAGRFPA
jgi:hypothetical protein